MKLPRKVKIIDVTARDGIEGIMRAIPVSLRVELIHRLADAGLPSIEIGEFVNPKVIPAAADTDQVARQIKPKDGVEYSAFVPNMRGFKDALACGVEHITIFASATEAFSRANINCSIETSFGRFEPVVAAAYDNGVRVRGALSVALSCPFEGKVKPDAVAELAVRFHEWGCYEICLGDTIGVGTPRLIKTVIQACIDRGVPISKLTVHFHDTFGMASVNCFAAMQIGVSTIESAAGGLGGCPNAPGASGNLATENLVYLLNGLGVETGVDLKRVIAIGRWICKELNQSVDSKVSDAMHRFEKANIRF